ARRVPSVLKWTLVTELVWPRRASVSCPRTGSHTRTRPSLPPLTTRRPSGLQHTQFTPLVCPRNDSNSFPSATSHTLTSPAHGGITRGWAHPAPTASRWPPGLKQRHDPWRFPGDPLNEPPSRPVLQAHSLTLPPGVATASVLPSGLNATQAAVSF